VKVTDILRFARERGEPVFSFEFFPPRTDEGERQLFLTVEALRPLGPAFVSVTYGPGPSTWSSVSSSTPRWSPWRT
jgi:methylenetetrahydrofolate reductase (NADPH)